MTEAEGELKVCPLGKQLVLDFPGSEKFGMQTSMPDARIIPIDPLSAD